ncbi:hypothetical protein ACFU9B_40265 [Streptomyces sp. NPDC057592]|uniref:hypothetical protein n=1 Tax=unclassified Streptomyces TaxID=2593676 RepID=UPI0036CAD367
MTDANPLETATDQTRPARHHTIAASGRPYGAPATDQEWARLHRDMAPRESWQPDHDERVGLQRYRDLAAMAPAPAESRLVMERHGHIIEMDHRGLLIDGRRVPGVTPPTATETRLPGDPYRAQALQVTDRGAVVVHGRIVASVTPDQDPTVYGQQAPAWARGSGHTVVADGQGLLVDGQRVSDMALPPPVGHAPLRIDDQGTVTWCEERRTAEGKTKRVHKPIASVYNPRRPDQAPVIYGEPSTPEKSPEPQQRPAADIRFDDDEEIDL